jgi:PAS domain S-box-containing protein
MSWTRGRIIAAAVAAAIFVAATASVGARLVGQLEEFRSAPRDNAQWSLAQIEVDLLQFTAALHAVMDGTGSPDAARLRFDLLYSRHAAIATGSVFVPLRADPRLAALVDSIGRFVSATAETIDRGDAAMRAEGEAIEARAVEAGRDARALMVEGVRLFAETSDARRLEALRTLRAAFVTALALIAALAASLVVLDRLRRTSARSAEGVRRSRSRLAATVDASQDAILGIDAEGRVRAFNEAAAHAFGAPAALALGRNAFDLLAPPRRPALRRALRRLIAAGQAGAAARGRVEVIAMRGDGSEFPAELSYAAAADEDGAPLVVVYLRDITDRVAAERALRVARDRALAADRAKSTFLAVMSHEMRTPLNGVMGLLDLLATTRIDARQAAYLDVARASAELLRRRVDEALDIGRIERGALRLEASAFDPAELARFVADVTRPAAAKADARIEVRTDPRLGPVMGDADRIRQVLLNLAANAARHGGGGRILIETRALAQTGDAVEIEFAVADEGPGVPPEDQRRIFDEFVTLGPGLDRGGSGAGLGLAICRRFVDAMGGDIGVESAQGAGSRFWVRLTLPRAAEPHASAPTEEAVPAAIRPLTVLCVEDNPTNRFVLREMLEGAGHRVIEARDGLEGVRLAAATRADVILMDIGMPGLDGVAAAAAIRAAAGSGPTPPIIALTAHAMPEERRRFADAGMALCLLKPVRRETLLTALASIARDLPEAGDRPEAGLLDDLILDDLGAAIGHSAAAATIRGFVADLDAALARLALAAAGSDEGLQAAAHRLAGTAGLVGAEALRRALGEVEAACKQGRGGEARAQADALPPLAARTAAALRDVAARLSETAA